MGGIYDNTYNTPCAAELFSSILQSFSASNSKNIFKFMKKIDNPILNYLNNSSLTTNYLFNLILKFSFYCDLKHT